MTDRPPRCRPLPPHVIAELMDPAPHVCEAALVARLEAALAALPQAERSAVVAAYAYDEGSVGAAMELGLGLEDADAVVRSALQLLRAAVIDDSR